MSFDGNLKAFPSVREHYDAMVAAGDVDADPAQLELTVRYDRLIEEICTRRLSRKSSALGWLFGKRKGGDERHQGALRARRGRTRQDHADGHVLFASAGRTQAPCPF